MGRSWQVMAPNGDVPGLTVNLAPVTSSVVVVPGPHPDAQALDRRVEELRLRFPPAIIDRYLDRVPSVSSRNVWHLRADYLRLSQYPGSRAACATAATSMLSRNSRKKMTYGNR
jgi:hypothetical protein